MLHHRALTCILAAIIIASPLASCAKDASFTPAADSADTAAPSSEPETADPLADDLPAADLNGWNFRIGAAIDDLKWIHYIYVDELSGETINDAVYQSNTTVSERFNFNFKHIPYASTNNGNYNALAELQQSTLAGDNLYDILTMHDAQSTKLVLSGGLRNVHELEYLNFDKPWWSPYTVNSLTVNGRMYQMDTAMSYYGMFSTRCLFFNKTMMTDLGIPLPYEKVLSGKWFIDDLIDMTKDVYTDVNGDGVRGPEDHYGLALTGKNATYDFLEGFGIDTFKHIDGGKKLELDVISDRLINMLQKTNNWINGGPKGVYYALTPTTFDYSTPDSAMNMLGNGKLLFAFNSIGRQVEACMNGDFAYGIVPLPKLDEQQTDYIGGCSTNPVCVPITNTNMKATGLIVEAMSAEGYRTIQPAYEEVVLKSRYAPDPECVEILDIILTNRFLSAGFLYADSSMRFQMIHDHMWSQFSSNIDVVSYYEANKNLAQQQLDKLNEFFNR